MTEKPHSRVFRHRKKKPGRQLGRAARAAATPCRPGIAAELPCYSAFEINRERPMNQIIINLYDRSPMEG